MDENDAIQNEDVSADPATEQQPPAETPEPNPELTPRQKRMAEIVESRREEAVSESEEKPDPTPEPKSEEEPEPPAAPPEPEPEPEEMLTVKVNGKEEEIPLSKAKALIQKNMAADQRLQQASERELQVKQREEQLAQLEEQLRQQQLDSQSQSQQPSEEPPEDAVTDDTLKELVSAHRQAIYDGEDEEADSLMLKIIKAQSGRQQPTQQIDPAVIAQQTAEQVKAELAQEAEKQQRDAFEAERLAAVDKFKADFSDIAEDPRLFHMADQISGELMQENPGMRPGEILQKAGESVRSWMNDKGLSKSDTMADRQQRKQKLSTMPRPSGATHEPPAEPKPKTPQDIIRDMRSARHF